MYGMKIAAAPKTQVYQPYGVMTTMRMKHTMRMPIMMRYRLDRAPASSRGARGSDVAEGGRLRTLHGASRLRRARRPVAGLAAAIARATISRLRQVEVRMSIAMKNGMNASSSDDAEHAQPEADPAEDRAGEAIPRPPSPFRLICDSDM